MTRRLRRLVDARDATGDCRRIAGRETQLDRIIQQFLLFFIRVGRVEMARHQITRTGIIRRHILGRDRQWIVTGRDGQITGGFGRNQ